MGWIGDIIDKASETAETVGVYASTMIGLGSLIKSGGWTAVNKSNIFGSDTTLAKIVRSGNGSSSSYENSIYNRKIGLVANEYDLAKATLERNIGSGHFDHDGYATPIGSLADTELNLQTNPWFIMDEDKNRYDNYIRYVNALYFNGWMPMPNFRSAEERAMNFDINSLLLSENKVGAVRGYDISDTASARNMVPYGIQTNVNGYEDTKLGVINNFYLNATLNASYSYLSQMGSYMTTGVEDDSDVSNVTIGAYNKFGFLGEKGMKNGGLEPVSGVVENQSLFTADIIPSTPIESDYDTFGNYYDTSLSNSLYDASSSRTKELIAKSMFGYDLLDEQGATLDDIISLSNKKYYVAKDKTGKDYLTLITGDKVSLTDDVDTDKHIRYNVNEAGYGNSVTSRILYTYAEAELESPNGASTVPYTSNIATTYHLGVDYNKYDTYENVITSADAQGNSKNDLLSYTNKRFTRGKIDTLIARFHTNVTDGTKRDPLSSAVSSYGMSHGRNLLKKDHVGSKDNGYSNPYCRVWTYHYQYNDFTKTIRPFSDDNKSLSGTLVEKSQHNRLRLEKNSVRDENNRLVRFAPTSENYKEKIKRCMFSIENLAWRQERDGFQGHEDQKGPFGGRIMWFPPYGLKFNENVNVGWNSTQFIGRGENIYTYTNTERGGSLDFKLLIDHPTLINEWQTETSNGTTDVDDVNSTEQKLLRFFAGCEILEPYSADTTVKPKIVEKPTIPSEPKQEPTVTPSPTTVQVSFYVFYPNNYSGEDDDANGVVKPMEYLLNGIACQKSKRNGSYVDIGTTMSGTFKGYETFGNGIDYGLDTVNGGSKAFNGTDFYTYDVNNKNGKKNHWAYRVDERYKDEVFRNSKSYTDSSSSKLNSSGYKTLLDYHTEANEFIENGGQLYSFAEVFCALQDDGMNVLSGVVNKDNVEALKKMFNEYDVVSVESHGFASSHGYTTNNNRLDVNRARSVVNWLKSRSSKFSVAEVTESSIGPKLNTSSAADLEAKVWRCACAIITLQQATVNELNEISTNQSEVLDTEQVEKVSNLSLDSVSSINTQGMTAVNKNSVQNQLSYNSKKAESDLKTASDNSDANPSNSAISEGYGKEYEFFKDLERNSPLLRNKIVDKIKYFDPAYHSITPEGFNARLTFLHQCTRQGSTSSASDNKSYKTASNLAFGAPPVCVLRIGDFFYTKIIIESLTIAYDDCNWDLNDEGIGIMPMIADVNIGFKFLGGSDITGPISRLQNAVSFNYYANTGVYDDRAEEAEFDDDGNIISFKRQQD